MIDISKFNFGVKFDVKEALKSAIVTESEEIKNSTPLLQILDGNNKVTVCTRGNISAIIGKAKSRKTFFITMLTVVLILGRLFNKFISPQQKKYKIVFFDTEQGRGRAQKVLKRIMRMVNSSKNIDMLSLRPYSTSERISIIEEYFETKKPDFAVIDGIRDLIRDFNNLEQSTELITLLLRISEMHDCHLCCILHVNKVDNNARGHIGSELINKAESVIILSMEKGSNFTTVEADYMRDGGFEPFQFTVIDHLPVVCGFEEELFENNDKNLDANKEFDSPF